MYRWGLISTTIHQLPSTAAERLATSNRASSWSRVAGVCVVLKTLNKMF